MATNAKPSSRSTGARSSARPRTNTRAKSARTSAKTRAGSARTSAASNATRTNRSSRTDASQVREGVTKARNGAAAIVRQGAERAVDVPVGAALTVRDRVSDVVEPLTTSSGREKELRSLRTQVTREFNKFERRGGQARRQATQRVRSTRTRVQREVKQNRTKAERQLKKAQKVVKERVPVGS